MFELRRVECGEDGMAGLCFGTLTATPGRDGLLI
jgi:hypothetical protein